MFILYRFYSKRRKPTIPYFRTICVLGLLIFIHVLQLLMFFNKINLLPVGGDNDKKGWYFLIAGIVVALVAIGFGIKERDLQNMEYDEVVIRRGGVYVTIYIILSLALFFLLALYGPGWKS